MGDVIITLPYIRGFKKKYPDIEIHFLTREEDKLTPELTEEIDKVWMLGGGRNQKMQFLYFFKILPSLIYHNFDIVFDLQNNKITKILRAFYFSKPYTAFDRFSPIPAGERTLLTINAVGLDSIDPVYGINEQIRKSGTELLGMGTFKNTICIVNPAGFFETRNWPIEHYINWAKLMIDHLAGKVKFLFVGIDRIAEKAELFEQEFPLHTINLVNKTSQVEAMGLVQCANIMLTEDSGLMHMAWTSGIPTLAIFGSTRSDWSRPLGKHSLLLSSADLECGNCLLRKCKFGDNRCLTRYTPEIVFEHTKALLKLQ